MEGGKKKPVGRGRPHSKDKSLSATDLHMIRLSEVGSDEEEHLRSHARDVLLGGR